MKRPRILPSLNICLTGVVAGLLLTGAGCTSTTSGTTGNESQSTSGGTGSGPAATGSTTGESTSSGATTTGRGSGTSSGGTTTNGFNPGPTCNPAGPNTCDAGTVCSIVAPTTTAITFECQPPAELYPCTPGDSCITSNLACTAFTNGSYCVQPCVTSDDCFDFLMVCTATNTGGFCLPRECGPGLNPANGSKLLSSCNAVDAGDGECVTLGFSDGAQGDCARTGPLGAGDACSYYAFSGGTQQLCGPGLTCFVSTIDGVSARCQPICDATNACPTGKTCVSALPPVNPPPLSVLTTALGWGACLDTCAAGSPDGGCGGNFLCQANNFNPGTSDVCQPN